MNYKHINFYSNLILILIFIYLVIALGSHYISPTLNDISISIENNLLNSEIQDIIINVNSTYSNYYLIIYQDDPKEHWIYFTSSNYTDDLSLLTDNFSPLVRNNCIILQGNKEKNNFKFSIKPKYALDYVTTMDNLFHVYYVVPYSFFVFNKFYYSKHFYFYVHPII